MKLLFMILNLILKTIILKGTGKMYCNVFFQSMELMQQFMYLIGSEIVT